MKGALIVVAAAVVLGLGGWKAGIFKHQATPQELLTGSMAATKAAPQGTEVVALKIKTKAEGDAAYKEVGNVNLTVTKQKGATISDTKANIDFDGSFVADDSGSPFSKIDLGGSFRLIGKIFYLKVTKLPVLPFFDPATVKDKWFSIDAVDLARKFGGEEKAKEIETQLDAAFNNTAAKENYSGLLAKNNFIVMPTFVGTEKIQGHTVKKISFGIDKSKLSDFVIEMVAAASATADSKQLADMPTREELTEMLADVNVSKLVVGVSTDTHLIYSIEMNMEISGSTMPETLALEMSATMDYDTPVSIMAPEKSDSIEKLLGPIFQNLMMGGMK